MRTDSIPLSDVELEAIKEVYTHNKLLMKKSGRGKMVTKKASDDKIIDIDKKIEVPKVVKPITKKAVALIGGGICLALFVLLWIYMASSDDD